MISGRQQIRPDAAVRGLFVTSGFVIAAYLVIIGGLALYTVLLWRRLRAVRGRDDEAR